MNDPWVVNLSILELVLIVVLPFVVSYIFCWLLDCHKQRDKQ